MAAGRHLRHDAEQHGLTHSAPGGDRLQPLHLLGVVDDDLPDPGLDRELELGIRLVIAVERDRRGIGARSEAGGELAAGRGEQTQTLLERRLHDPPRGEGLDGVEGCRKGGGEGAAPLPEVLLVDDEQGRAEPMRELGGRNTADIQSARATTCAHRPWSRGLIIISHVSSSSIGKRKDPSLVRGASGAVGRDRPRA